MLRDVGIGISVLGISLRGTNKTKFIGLSKS